MLATSADPRPVRWARFLLGSVALWAVLAGLSEIDATGGWGLVILLGVGLTAVAVERVMFGSPVTEGVRRLGLGRPSRRALAPAAAIAGLLLLLYPLTGAVTGGRFALVPDWPWTLVGLVAFHGLAEEIVWRGFIFRHLSQGRSLRRAVLWSMPFVGAAHLPMLFTSGPVVALGALLVAAVTSVPLSWLYVVGRRTVWAPALVHSAIDSFSLVVVPVAAAGSFPLMLIGFSLVVPLLALLAPGEPGQVRRAASRDPVS